MKKLNQKGMTAVELLATFAIVSVILISLFDVILNYKNRQQTEAIDNEVLAYANGLQKDIQDNLIKKHLTNVTISSPQNATLTFNQPNLVQDLAITPGNYDTYDVDRPDTQGYITYDGIKYPLPTISDLILDSSSSITKVGSTDHSFLVIHIVLRHPNFKIRIDEDYGIFSFDITCPINYIK